MSQPDRTHSAAQDRGCLSEQAPDTVSGGGTPGTSSAARNRYSVGAELWVNAADEGEARMLVGNFLDGFPDAVDGHDGDVLMQDTTLVEEGVEDAD